MLPIVAHKSAIDRCAAGVLHFAAFKPGELN